MGARVVNFGRKASSRRPSSDQLPLIFGNSLDRAEASLPSASIAHIDDARHRRSELHARKAIGRLLAHAKSLTW